MSFLRGICLQVELMQLRSRVAGIESDLAAERARADELAEVVEACQLRLDDAGISRALPDGAGSRIGRLARERNDLRAERDRLRAAIEQAPHGAYCLGDDFLLANDKRVNACNCWKRAALEAK